MAAQNMLLMAYALGFGSCVVASFSQKGVEELLRLPKHIYPALVIALGFTGKQPVPPGRKTTKLITSWEQFQECEAAKESV